jgi:hypothetical protein
MGVLRLFTVCIVPASKVQCGSQVAQLMPAAVRVRGRDVPAPAWKL